VAVTTMGSKGVVCAQAKEQASSAQAAAADEWRKCMMKKPNARPVLSSPTAMSESTQTLRSTPRRWPVSGLTKTTLKAFPVHEGTSDR
jgi:hypothetical protein